MLSLSEYHPAFFSFAECCCELVEERISAREFAPVASAFARFLEQLQRRLNWELPLIEAFSEAASARELLVGPLQDLHARLLQGSPTPELLANLQSCLAALYRVQCFFEQLPSFTDVGVINDLLLLGAQDPPPAKEAIAHRIPILLEWIADLEAQWELFADLYPGHRGQQQLALTVVKALQGAAGGLHLYTQGEGVDVLTEALKLMKNAVEELALLEQRRFQVESEHLQGSMDVRLSRGFQLLERDSTLPESYRRTLLQWVAEKQRQLMIQRGWNQLARKLPEEQLHMLQGELDQWARRLPDLREAQADQLRELEQWRIRFAELAPT
jgi:hypothetical protein